MRCPEMSACSPTADLPPPPLPPEMDLRPFPLIWMNPRVLQSGPFLRLKKRNPRAAIALFCLYQHQWQTVGGGLQDDPDSLAHAAGVDPDEWVEDVAPALESFLIRANNGLVYLDFCLDDVRAAWRERLRRKERTDAARKRRAENRKARPEGETPRTSLQHPQASSPAEPSQPSYVESGKKVSVGRVESSPGSSPALRAGTSPDWEKGLPHWGGRDAPPTPERGAVRAAYAAHKREAERLSALENVAANRLEDAELRRLVRECQSSVERHLAALHTAEAAYYGRAG